MSEQIVTEPESACITGASKPKSYGQVGYETMLARVRANEGIPGHDSELDCSEMSAALGAWENQPQMLRDDWEAIGNAIVKVFGDRVIEYCERNKAVQP